MEFASNQSHCQSSVMLSIVPTLMHHTRIGTALQRHNTENLKQIFPETELRSLSPNFHITYLCVSV